MCTAWEAANSRSSGMTVSDAPEVIDASPVDHHRKGPLYAPRWRIHPKRVQGRFRRLKWWIMGVTMAVYYVTPWLRWDRGPHVSDQAVLVDLENRRFFFFFIEIWPHELYFVAGLLVMAGLGLFLVTSTVGRAWCGYTCPQTVWVDLFLAVEGFVEGDRLKRIRLDGAPWTFDKLRKRVFKHAVWLLIAVATGGAWIFYFADAPTLAAALVTADAPAIAYTTVAFLTATTYVLGGLLREQVCVYMCPWPRIQGAMLDEHSLTVTYNEWRGEPRSRHVRRHEHSSTGDCVDCNACVAVCPMGIDIREGQQFECITCALCMDACDHVMQKLERPEGLISYATLADHEVNMALARKGDGTIDPARVRDGKGDLIAAVRRMSLRRLIRPRTMAYTAAWTAIGLVMIAILMTRDRVDLHVVHDRNPVFVQLTDGAIRNGYTVKVLNMRPEPREFRLSTLEPPGVLLRSAGSTEQPAPTLTLAAAADSLEARKIFLRLPREDLGQARVPVVFVIEDLEDGTSAGYEAVFEGPPP